MPGNSESRRHHHPRLVDRTFVMLWRNTKPPKSFTATDSIITTPCYSNGWDWDSLPSLFGNICWAEW